MKRRKLVRQVRILQERQVRELKAKTVDELDEYVMMLETHRIKLVAKLKAVFDRFDHNKDGRLTPELVEQSLVYMNRPVDSAEVAAWLDKLRDNRVLLEFPEFVAQYSGLFAGEDPDVPVGEKPSGDDDKEKDGEVSGSERRRRRSTRDGEKWYDEEDSDRDRDRDDENKKENPEKDITDIKVVSTKRVT
jgi:hypothetical protein